jgi:hypothetical protein
MYDHRQRLTHSPLQGIRHMSNKLDPVREAAALLDELATQAQGLARRLRSDTPLPAAAIAGLLVDVNRQSGRLAKHADRLAPQKGGAS